MSQPNVFKSALVQIKKEVSEEKNSGLLFLMTATIIVGEIKTLLTDFKIACQNISFIKYQNSGKDITMKNDFEIKSVGFKLEFSGPRTPQRNGKLEINFQNFYGRIRSNLNGASLEDELRDKI
jgi:hypothetical protein